MKNLQHMSEVVNKVLRVLRIHQDVIKVDNDVLIQNRPKNLVHEVHENHQGICQTEGHNLKFKVATPTTKHHFQYIFDSDSHLMISKLEINLRGN